MGQAVWFGGRSNDQEESADYAWRDSNNPRKTRGKSEIPDTPAHHTAHFPPGPVDSDPFLASVIAAAPALTEDQKNAVLALLRGFLDRKAAPVQSDPADAG